MREGEPNLEIIESKKEQVKSFLKVELPETEERIEEKMDPECQVCVVIPCCGERDYILRSLMLSPEPRSSVTFPKTDKLAG